MISVRGKFFKWKAALMKRVVQRLTVLHGWATRHHQGAAAQIADSSSLVTARWAICSRCPLLNQKTKVCGSCGCFMPVKVQMPKAACPQKHW